MATVENTPQEAQTIFFTWIRGSDGLEHAVLDTDLASAIAYKDRGCAYPAVCRYRVIPDIQLSSDARCCHDCVNALPRNALSRRGRRDLITAAHRDGDRTCRIYLVKGPSR